MGKYVIITYVVFMTLFVQFAFQRKCEPGTYRYNNTRLNFDFCIECPEGTYMSLSGHQQTKCKSCENISEPNVEILVSPCNKTHDAVIYCVDGYYRELARNARETGKCRICTKCHELRMFTGKPCGAYRDSICCMGENYDVVRNNDSNLECRERPWFCRRGQYFDTHDFLCLPCPNNTFMSLDYHIQPKCWDCRELEADRPLHSVIIQQCNSTHAPVIECEDGFFRSPNMGFTNDATGCSQCTNCSTNTDLQYEGRRCNSMEDTVCCPQANMTVVNTPEGPVCCPKPDMTIVNTSDGLVCVALSATCDVGSCLLYHVSNGLSTCGRCFNNTDGDQPDKSFEDPTFPSGESKRAIVLPKERENKRKTAFSNVGFTFLHFLAGLATGLMIIILFVIILYHWKCLRESFISTWICGQVRSLTERYYRSLHRHEREEQEPLNTPGVDIKLARKPRTVSMSDYGELVHSFGNETDLGAEKQICPRLSDHSNLFGVEDLRDSLPPDFRDQGYLDYITATSDLTVRLRVHHVSEERPENDPYYELRGLAGSGLRRYGNGLVFKASKRFDEHNTEKCPCKDCQVFPENAKIKWAEFLVVTSTQIVFDETECGQTSCKLWSDTDKNQGKILSLKGWRLKETDKEKDICVMRCVSHNPEVINELEKRVIRFNSLYTETKQASNDDTRDVKKLAVLIAHPHGLSKKIFLRNAHAEGGQAQKWTYDANTCRGCLGAPVCLLSKKKGSKIWVTIYNGNCESKGFELEIGM